MGASLSILPPRAFLRLAVKAARPPPHLLAWQISGGSDIRKKKTMSLWLVLVHSRIEFAVLTQNRQRQCSYDASIDAGPAPHRGPRVSWQREQNAKFEKWLQPRQNRMFFLPLFKSKLGGGQEERYVGDEWGGELVPSWLMISWNKTRRSFTTSCQYINNVYQKLL